MRCDYPMGFDEDFLEPPCDGILQIFMQNAPVAANDDLNQDDESADDSDLEDSESYDSHSSPSLLTVTDDSMNSGEIHVSDEDWVEIIDSDTSFNSSEIEGSCSPGNIVEVIETSNDSTDPVSGILESSPASSKNPDDNPNVAVPLLATNEGTSNVLPLSHEASFLQESSNQTDLFLSNIDGDPSSYVSQYVEVSNISNESDSWSSDHIPFMDIPTLYLASSSDNDNDSDVSLCSNCFPYKHCEDSVSDTENSNLLERNAKCDKNSHPKSVASSSEEKNIQNDGDIDCDVISDNSVSNLKRKVVSSVEDAVIHKIPKYLLSGESSESGNAVSVDNYCNELSGAKEDATVSEDNTTNLPSQKISEESSDTEEQKDLKDMEFDSFYD